MTKNSKIWGPSCWLTLHFFSMYYPENPTQNDIENHTRFLNILPMVLPCEECSQHFRSSLNENNINEALQSKKKYIELIYKLHNSANKITHKHIMKYDDFIELYQNIMNETTFNPISIYNANKRMKYIIYVLIIIISILIYMMSIKTLTRK